MLVDEAAAMAAVAAEDTEHQNMTLQEGAAGSRYSFILRYLVALVLSGRTS
jgi:hypothetical protein